MRPILLAVCAGCAIACGSEGAAIDSTSVASSLSDSISSGQVALVVYSARDTIGSGEHVRLVVALRSSSEPVDVSNLPENYSFIIVGPSGDTVPSTAGPYESGLYGSEPQLSIPRDGFVGQVVDLACVVPHYGGRDVSERPCMFAYSLTQPGQYKISVRFRSTWRGQAPAGIGPIDLFSDPVTITVR